MPEAKTNNIRTCYEINGDGPALVLIPGMGMSRRLWKPQIESFSRHFRVIAYDVRGHGDSGASDEKYSIKLFASDLKALLDTIGINKANICGLSMGGLIAQQCAIDYPDMVDRLIIIGAFCHINLMEKALAVYIKVIHRILLLFMNMEKYAELHARTVFKKEEQQELRDFFIREKVDKISKKEFLKAMSATFSFDSLNRLKEIKSPTLILSAEGGKRERRQADIMSGEIKGSRKELIPDTYHVSNLEKPDELNRLVLDFLLEGGSHA